MAALRSTCEHYTLQSVVSFFFLYFAYSQQSEIGCLPYFHRWCRLRANLECRSEMCCTRLAGNTGRKNRHRTILSGYIFGNKACIDNPKKNLLNSNTSSTWPDNMVNFGLLTAEICWRVWGTPANFNMFRDLTALLHGTLVVGVSQTLRRWTEGAAYISAGRPSRWALAHILVWLYSESKKDFGRSRGWGLCFAVCTDCMTRCYGTV